MNKHIQHFGTSILVLMACGCQMLGQREHKSGPQDYTYRLQVNSWGRDLIVMSLGNGIGKGGSCICEGPDQSRQFLAWETALDDIVRIHDAVTKVDFWRMKDATNELAVLDPMFVTVEVVEDGRSHKVTRMCVNDSDPDMMAYYRIVHMIVSTVPHPVQGLPTQEFCESVAKIVGMPVPCPVQKDRKGIFLGVETNRVIDRAFLFRGETRTEVVPVW